jgi:hypothetical protein
MKTRVSTEEEAQRHTRLAAKVAPSGAQTEASFEDTRPDALALKSLRRVAGESPLHAQLKSTQAIVMASPQAQRIQSLQTMANRGAAVTVQKYALETLSAEPVQQVADEESLQGRLFENRSSGAQLAAAAEAPRPNNTGLPDDLKSGVESLSGMSLDRVKVHYNSDKPSQLQAHAYAQGSEIHLAPGQERHLQHEAWHVVQQAQGRVRPTMQMKGNLPVNDDAGLESEADVMGAKAVNLGQAVAQKAALSTTAREGVPGVVQRAELANDKLNVAGEFHDISGARRPSEIAYSAAMTGGRYWQEHEFTVGGLPADDFVLRAKNLIAYAKRANLGFWLKTDTYTLVLGLISGKVTVDTLGMPLTLFRPGELEMYKDHIPSDIYQRYGNTLLTDRGTLEKSIGTVKSALTEYLATRSSQWKGVLDDAVGAYQILFGILEMQVDQVMEALDIISTDEVSLARSRKMHAAANTSAATKGLWKVGNKHTQDMATMNPKAYNHMLVADFNVGYFDFVRRTALGEISAKANGNWSPYTKWKSVPTGISAIKDIIGGAGAAPAATVLRQIKARAITDNGRQSDNRDARTTSFYTALAGMDVDNLASMSGIPALMDGIVL